MRNKKHQRAVFWSNILLIGLILFFLQIITPAFAQLPNTITWNLKDFAAEENDIRLEGYQPSYVFFLPNYKGVNWDETHLALKIWFSEALNSESSVSLLINEQLIYTKLLKDIQLQPDQVAYLDIPIPTTTLKANDNLIKFEIQPTLIISDNICKDVSSGNLWIIIKKESFITFKTKTDWIPQTIDDFLQSIMESIIFVLPPQPWSDRILQSYFTMQAFLHKINRNHPFKILTLVAPSQLNSYDSIKSYQIYLLENSGSDYQLYGKKLFLTPEGVNAIVTENQKILINSSGKVIHSFSVKIPPQANKTTFFNLGYSSFKLKGFGNMERNLRFYYSDISNHPTTLTLRLFFNHTPLPPEFKGEALIKLSINSQHIYSQRLDAKSGGKLLPIELYLPFQFLKPINNLTIGLSYFPDQENCRPSMMPFEGFFSDQSYFQVKNSTQTVFSSSWKQITAVPGNNIKIVLPTELDQDTLQTAAEILSSLQLYKSALIPVEIIFGDTSPDNLLSSPSSKVKWNPYYYHGIWNYYWENLIQIPKMVQNTLSTPEYLHLNFFQKLIMTIYNITLPYGQFASHFLASFLSNPIPIQTNQINNQLLIIISPDKIPTYLSSPITFESNQMIMKNPIQNKEKFTMSLTEPISCLMFFYQNRIPLILFTSYGQKSIALSHFKKYFNPKTTFFDLSGNFAIFEKNGIIDMTFPKNPHSGY